MDLPFLAILHPHGRKDAILSWLLPVHHQSSDWMAVVVHGKGRSSGQTAQDMAGKETFAQQGKGHCKS